jgi:hypothetical protein
MLIEWAVFTKNLNSLVRFYILCRRRQRHTTARMTLILLTYNELTKQSINQTNELYPYATVILSFKYTS